MFIIAEIGFNHEGDLDQADAMIRAAARAGADAVKFQTFRASDLALPDAPHYKLIECGELDRGAHQRLAKTAGDEGVDFLSTPFSVAAVDMLQELGVPAFKVASMDCTNKHLLGRIAATGKPVYLSTGMANETEISESLAFLKEQNSGPVSILHCVSVYPPPADALNLATIPWLKERFGIPVGYSDHYPGIDACIAAAALGAEIIEVHFTLDTTKPEGDHGHSADEAQLGELVRRTADFHAMTGRPELSGRKDRNAATMFRRGMYAARDLIAGELLTEADLLFCRPASALGPSDLKGVLGKCLIRPIDQYTAIENDMFNQ